MRRAGIGDGLQRHGAQHQRAQIQIDLLLHENAQHADGGTPQSEGILGAAGLLADGEDSGQRIQLVGQRHGHSGTCAGQRTAGATG
jgi:hypothetical protein